VAGPAVAQPCPADARAGIRLEAAEVFPLDTVGQGRRAGAEGLLDTEGGEGRAEGEQDGRARQAPQADPPGEQRGNLVVLRRPAEDHQSTDEDRHGGHLVAEEDGGHEGEVVGAEHVDGEVVAADLRLLPREEIDQHDQQHEGDGHLQQREQEGPGEVTVHDRHTRSTRQSSTLPTAMSTALGICARAMASAIVGRSRGCVTARST